MPHEVHSDESARVERVGPTGIYPASGPLPSTDAPLRTQGALGHPEEYRHVLGSASREHAAVALGRVLFGGYFLYNGANHFLNHGMMTQYANSKQVPAARLAVPLSGALILLGGLSLLTGTRPKIGASLITAFLLGVTPKMHDFWNVDDEQQRMQEFINFTKNLALIGGAALAAAVPEPWPWSADYRSRALVTT